MADEAQDGMPSGSWRRGWAGAGALLATLLLIALVAMVTLTNRQRDEALGWERHTQDVMLLTRSLDATLSRAEAALGRFVLDEQVETSGYTYSAEWQNAGRQIGQLQRLVRRDAAQVKAVGELKELYDRRGKELAPAAAAAVAKRGSDGPSYFWHAGRSETVPSIRSKLDQIATQERATMAERRRETGIFAAEAERMTDWLGWVAVLVGFGAVVFGAMAYRALNDQLIAQAEADSEAGRASALEEAVRTRTRELSDANERLRAEAAEREAAEAQLRQVQKMEAVGQLTGGIAHDFNNMLAVVVGGLDIARRRLSGPRTDVEPHLDSAMEGANRAAALTRRLLAFSRAEALLPEAISAAGLVDGMLDLVDRTIGERIEVRTILPDDDWQIWADRSGLENAILNLAVNARDAMEGEGRITIGVENVRLTPGEVASLAPGEYVRISVGDTGSGIAPEHLEKVFEPFFTTKPVGKGTGLGLSQIFGFARQSGGDVTVESSVGVGTTVALYLPRSTRTAVAGAAQSARISAFEQAVEGTSIVVVEDDPRVSRSTVSALEELGYRPRACAGGEEALAIMREQPVDLVITDVMMPGMTGPELVRILAREYPATAVLFVTGYVGDAGEAVDLSGYDLLRKPFTVSALAEAVAAALGFSEPRRASASAAAE